MTPTYDVIVIGAGGVGSAAAYHCARRGARVLAIDRFHPPHDQGSSHGQTRIIRQAYFEHPDYVPLLLRAYALWEEIEQAAAERLLFRVGLLQVGPAEGHVVRGVLESATQHGLAVERLSQTEIAARYPAFNVPENCIGAHEPAAGYLLVDRCVAACTTLAARAGAQLLTNTVVHGWKMDGDAHRVSTDRGDFLASRLIITAGPWASSLLADLNVPLVVRCKRVYWFNENRQNTKTLDGYPTYLFDLPTGVFYGFPPIEAPTSEIRGIKIARHTGGETVAEPSGHAENLDESDYQLVANFIARHIPALPADRFAHGTCYYTMSPDEHFIVDTHPNHPGISFAAGLSGHGYKFTPVLGEILADLAECGATRQPIKFLRLARP